MPKVKPVPATATKTASVVHPWSATTADSEATVPTTPSPSAMIVSSPFRSTMWCACHGVPPIRFSASNGQLDGKHHGDQDESDALRVVGDGNGHPPDLCDGDSDRISEAGGPPIGILRGGTQPLDHHGDAHHHVAGDQDPVV